MHTTTSNFTIYSHEHIDSETESNFLFSNPSDFSFHVESQAQREGRSCTSVILEYCELRDLDPEDIAKLISRSLKEKLMVEMQIEGLMPRTATLEFE